MANLLCENPNVKVPVSADFRTSSQRTVYYISDLHLEAQINFREIASDSVSLKKRIDEKIDEMINSVNGNNEFPLLIAGDVGDSLYLVEMFYSQLVAKWHGEIIVTLGNHELWNIGESSNLNIDEVIMQYRQMFRKYHRIFFLENDLLIKRRRGDYIYLSEKEIYGMSASLMKVYFDSSVFIILGGIGFSGKNQIFNSSNLIYGNRLNGREEKKRSERFWKLHEYIKKHISNERVIVLSHMPPSDWCEGSLFTNWIYICGHNHNNCFVLGSEQANILSDNQIGFKPQRWGLKSLNFNHINNYDPFACFDNGIHLISTDDYLLFNRCAGILVTGFKRQGDLYLIKHENIYLFMFRYKEKMYLLRGGQLIVPNHDMQYYQEHLPKYVSQIKKAFFQYDKAIKEISEEVRRFGGTGYIHGAIIDIDYYNHIFLNPIDGKVSFYYAQSTTERILFSDFDHLVKESPNLPMREIIINNRNKTASNSENVLSTNSAIAIPQIGYEKDMYDSSRNMRSVQYIMEKNVIRFWSDSVFDFDFGDEKEPAEGILHIES